MGNHTDRPAGSPDDSEAPRSATLRREGDHWIVVFEDRVIRLKHTRGITYLATLLRHPHVDVPAIELAGRSITETTPDPAAVERARKAVASRLRAVVGRIDGYHASLGVHLRHALHTGRSCRYTPDFHVQWAEGTDVPGKGTEVK